MEKELVEHVLNTAKAGLSKVPHHLHKGIFRYIEQGVPVGRFLTAVISNDLKESFAQADHINRSRLFDIVNFFYNCAPEGCWGSPEKMKAWVERGGIRGPLQTGKDKDEETV